MELTLDEVMEQLPSLIATRRSFVVIGAGGNLLKTSERIENAIESAGLSCRVYTRNRSIAAGAMAWSGIGLLSLAGIAAHNLATFNPDYEIGRAAVDNKIYVDYKK